MPRKKTTPTTSPAKYVVLRDTGEHENKGWWFDPSDVCDGTVERNLYTADYSLVVGGDDLYARKHFVVERKGSVAEFAQNLSQKEKWDDFKQELERLEEFTHPFLVLEFGYDLLLSFPEGSGIPRSRWPQLRVTARFLQKRLHEIELRFKTRVEFVGARGREWASSMFKRITEDALAQA